MGDKIQASFLSTTDRNLEVISKLLIGIIIIIFLILTLCYLEYYLQTSGHIWAVCIVLFLHNFIDSRWLHLAESWQQHKCQTERIGEFSIIKKQFFSRLSLNKLRNTARNWC